MKKRKIPIVPKKDRGQLHEGINSQNKTTVIVSFLMSKEIYDKYEKFVIDNCVDADKLIETSILKHIETTGSTNAQGTLRKHNETKKNISKR